MTTECGFACAGATPKLRTMLRVLIVLAFALLAAPPDRRFDYIYIAPPQFKDMWAQALTVLDENPGWLSDEYEVIVQIAPKEHRKLDLANLEELEQRKYGSTMLVFYGAK